MGKVDKKWKMNINICMRTECKYCRNYSNCFKKEENKNVKQDMSKV